MSVTSLVREKKFLARLRAIYPAHQIKPTGDFLVPKTHERSDHIGTAFDYLFRIVLARAAKLPTPHLLWDADQAPRCISPRDDELAYSEVFPWGKTGHFSRSEDGIGAKRHVWAHQVLANAKRDAAAYHESGLITADLLWACYQLSFLEIVVRGGADKAMHIDPEKLSTPDESAIEELRQLVELVDLRGLQIRSSLFLAPALEVNALADGGAPDLLVDGWVCELKVVTSMSDARRWTDQLVVYAVLAAMGGFDLTNTDFWTASGSFVPSVIRGESSVKGIAIYFARHAEWVRVPLDDLFTKEQLLQVGQLLCERLQENEPGRRFSRVLLANLSNYLRVRSVKAKCSANLTNLQQATLARLKSEGIIPGRNLSTSEAHAMRALNSKGLAYPVPIGSEFRDGLGWEA